MIATSTTYFFWKTLILPQPQCITRALQTWIRDEIESKFKNHQDCHETQVASTKHGNKLNVTLGLTWLQEVASPWFFGATCLRKLLRDYILFFIRPWKKMKIKKHNWKLWVEKGESDHCTSIFFEKRIKGKP